MSFMKEMNKMSVKAIFSLSIGQKINTAHILNDYQINAAAITDLYSICFLVAPENLTFKF